MDAKSREQIDKLHGSLRGWALADVRRAFEGGAKVGAFILAAHLIDTLAKLSYERGQGQSDWEQFIARYMPRYDGHARLLEDDFRNAISHNYSLGDIRLVDGADYAPRHWTIETGQRVLHFETFLDDLEDAYRLFEENLATDHRLRQRVLERARIRPPLGIVHEPFPESLRKARLMGLGATAWSGAVSSSASSDSWTQIDFPPDTTAPATEKPKPLPRMDIPKRRKKPQS